MCGLKVSLFSLNEDTMLGVSKIQPVEPYHPAHALCSARSWSGTLAAHSMHVECGAGLGNCARLALCAEYGAGPDWIPE